MGRLLRGLVAIACLVVLARTAAADDDATSEISPGQLKFRVFGSEDGLENLVIVSIVQDGNGFLWIATDDGVYRYDGERFTHFSIGEGLISTTIYTLGVAPDGEVCVGSDQGLVCWDGARFSQASTRGLPSIPVYTMVSFAGRFWVGTGGGGLYVQNRHDVFVAAPGWPAPTATVRALWADADGLVAANGGIVERSAGDGAWTPVEQVGIEGERIDGVLRDRQGALWVRTPSHMWFLPAGAARASDLNEGLATGYDAVGVATGMVLGPRGEVLIATDLGIGYREAGRWRVIGRSVGLPATTTRTLFVDREGTIWIGSIGLFQLRGRGLFERYTVANGLPGDVVWHYARDRQGVLWAGTSRCLAHADAGRWTCLPATEGRVVRSFVFPPQGGVFVGGAPSDILYVDPRGHATSLGELGRPGDHNTLALALGLEGDLWIGTKVGLFRLRGAIPGPLERVVIPGTRSDGRFASLVISGGQMWTASSEGIFVLEHGTWHGFDKAAGFRSSAMSYVVPRADGSVCAAYTEALGAVCFRYDGHAVSGLAHVGPAEGLTTGKIYFLGEDRQRRLWIGTGSGVDVVSPNGVEHFDEGDGLAGNDSAGNAFLSEPDGSLWLGSTGGATHVFAQYYDDPPPPPRTALLDGRLGDRSIHTGDLVTGLDTPHDRSALVLEFAAGSLVDAKRVKYQVRLSPLDTEWATTHQRESRYPALPPGTYRFEVRARVGAGPWGPVTALAFRVLPAWWQTGWFLGLAMIAALAALAAGFTWRQRAVLRRRTRQLHAQSDTSFRAVIDGMPDLISVYRDRKLVYLNEANRRFLGVDGSEDRWADLDLLERVHLDDRAQVTELFLRVRELGSPHPSQVSEVRMRAADGSWRVCEVSGVLVEMGGAPTVVASGRDVTERKRLRAQLMVSDRMASLGTLAAGIAHEINNPLAYVTGNLEAMAETVRGSSAAECVELSLAISDARDGAERVRKIVQGLRSFTRGEQEQRSRIALPDVLEAAIRLTANEVRHRAQLVRELAPLPLVLADDGKLTQVFINLLINAAQAIPEGHSDENRITVRTRTDDHGRAAIEIEDTGHGIALDLQSRVFDPFFTTKDVGEGTGLGLSICHGIVGGLGGQISIESAPGRGTVVRVVLPAAPAIPELPAPVAAKAPPPEPTPARRRRVMLVDDEPMVTQTVERLLRRDYDITIASCGQDAIGHIAGGARFDAIVSDVMMPNVTGLDLFDELQRAWPDQAARVVFLSGGAFTAQTRERLDALGVRQLEKPVTAKELRACLLQVAREADQRGGLPGPAASS